MKHLILIILSFLLLNVYSQTEQYLYYSLNNFNGNRVILTSIIGSSNIPIDTAYKQSTGAFVFNNIEKHPAGMYRLIFNDTIYTEIIINHENIVIESDANNIIQNMVVKKSIENKILFNYWKYALMVRDTISTLSFKRDKIEKRTYDSKHPEIIKINKHIEELNDEIYYYIERQIIEYPKLFAPLLLKSYVIPSMEKYNKQNPKKLYSVEKEFYFDHFFDNIDFSDQRFVNSKVLFVSISDFIETFGKPASTVNYIKVIDRVMSHAKENNAVYDYCVNLFMRTFENSIWEDVMVHIIDNYYMKTNNGKPKLGVYYSNMSNRIKALKPGVKSPNIIMQDMSGNTVNMHNINAKVKMLIFYSSDCPHCIESMPSLVEIYNMYKSKGLETIGIALDDTKSKWANKIKELNINWISISDLKGMSSPIISTYNITTTPTIIILNKDNIIMTKPKNINDIHATLVELLN